LKDWSLKDISNGTKANQASQLKLTFGKDPVSSKPLNIANAIFILSEFVIFNFILTLYITVLNILLKNAPSIFFLGAMSFSRNLLSCKESLSILFLRQKGRWTKRA